MVRKTSKKRKIKHKVSKNKKTKKSSFSRSKYKNFYLIRPDLLYGESDVWFFEGFNSFPYEKAKSKRNISKYFLDSFKNNKTLKNTQFGIIIVKQLSHKTFNKRKILKLMKALYSHHIIQLEGNKPTDRVFNFLVSVYKDVLIFRANKVNVRTRDYIIFGKPAMKRIYNRMIKNRSIMYRVRKTAKVFFDEV
jgi:hypothetical protein